MRALLAGFLSGAAVAFVHTAILLIAIVRGMRNSPGLRLPGSERVRPGLIGVLLVNLLMLIWTALGLVLGAAFLRVEAAYPVGSLGTPNRMFTGLVIAGVTVMLGLMAVVRPSWVGRTAWASAGVAVLAFGFMLPNLAAQR